MKPKIYQIKRKIRMMYFAKIKYNRTISCRGLFRFAFPLIFTGSLFFLWNIVSAKRSLEKKNYIWHEMCPSFCKPNFSYLTDEHVFKSTYMWYQMLVVNEKKTLRKNKSELGFSCTAWIPKILCKDVFSFCNSWWWYSVCSKENNFTFIK